MPVGESGDIKEQGHFVFGMPPQINAGLMADGVLIPDGRIYTANGQYLVIAVGGRQTTPSTRGLLDTSAIY